MAAAAAPLAAHVIPRLPVRELVLLMPSRMRHFLHHDPAVTTSALHLLPSAVAHAARAFTKLAAGGGRPSSRSRGGYVDGC